MAPLPFPIKLGIVRRSKYVVPRMHWPDEALYLCLEAGVAIRTHPLVATIAHGLVFFGYLAG